jgi:hypothetical protein
MISRLLLILVSVFLTWNSIFAATVSEKQAEQVVKGWLNLDNQPLKEMMNINISKVDSYHNANKEVLFYVVSLENGGYVITSADDLIEPIVAFSEEGAFDSSANNPLWSLINADMGGRLDFIKDTLVANQVNDLNVSQNRWQMLLLAADKTEISKKSLSSISDVRVAPLVQSKWNQDTVDGMNTYNYYTPSNSVCGCVATSMAQLMRYHKFPVSGIGVCSNTISFDDVAKVAYTRGGDGSGGAYDWDSMPLVPTFSITTIQRQAIGTLCYDAGVGSKMAYTLDGSSAYHSDAKTALSSFFGYANVVLSDYSSVNLPMTMINLIIESNMDAGKPIILGVDSEDGGHSIICDGYGYNSSTRYSHLNMGWAGADDLWYALPDVGTVFDFNIVDEPIYNVFPTQVGEIISGRILDESDNPISGVSVSADGKTDITDANGIYGLVGISVGSHIVTSSKSGYQTETLSKTVTSSSSVSCGNVAAANFILSIISSSSYSGGSGTEVDPYLIANVNDLLEIGETTADYDKHFLMTADIDLAGENFTRAIIAPDTSSSTSGFQGTKFSGTFDGDGNKILNLSIDVVTTNDYIGLFGNIGSGGEVRNLGIVDCNVSGNNYVGGLCGYTAYGTISSCYSTGTVSGNDYVGGLCGYSYSGIINFCYSTGSIAGLFNVGGLCGYNTGIIESSHSTGNVDGDSDIGGLCGRNYKGTIRSCDFAGYVVGASNVGGLVGSSIEGKIISCSADCDVTGEDWVGGLYGIGGFESLCRSSYSTGTVKGGYYVGGLSGYSGSVVSNSYSRCSVEGISHVGGFTGWSGSSVINSYSTGSVKGGSSTVGGFCGISGGAVENCFWDKETSEILTSAGGTGKTTAQMQTKSTFTDAGWDFVDTWRMWGYPMLMWQPKYSGGSGTESDPYLIANKADLLTLGTSTNDYGKSFKMTADIGLAGETFTSALIGQGSGIPFTGNFDGDGYKIINLAINTGGADKDYLGLFGYVSGAEIINLAIENASIFAGTGDIGVFCGYNDNGSIVECQTTGVIESEGRAGGLCGINAGIISNCYSSVDVVGDRGVGGFCAQNREGTIDNCYSKGSVNGRRNVGGLIGVNISIVNDCYSTGTVQGTINVGGFNGLNNSGGSIDNCYSTGSVNGDSYVGGFCGLENGGTISESFWDVQTSGRTGDSGGIGKTTAEMQTQSTFAGWDFIGTWKMNGYPELLCLLSPYELSLIDRGVPKNEQGYSDCPAGDGIQNLLKYAIGLDPMVSCSAEDVLTPLTDDDPSTFAVIYKKSKGTEDVLLFPTWTDSLIITNWGTNGFVYTMMSETDSNETWKATLPVTNKSSYIRLKARMQD